MPSSLNLGPEENRWMALDVGTKSIGVAISDPLKLMARPLSTLRRRSLEEDCEVVLKLMQDNQVERLLVGFPRHLGGEISGSSRASEALIELLRTRTHVPVERVEERLSTLEARRLMAEAGLPLAERRRRRDEIAAAVILMWYLQCEKSK